MPSQRSGAARPNAEAAVACAGRTRPHKRPSRDRSTHDAPADDLLYQLALCLGIAVAVDFPEKLFCSDEYLSECTVPSRVSAQTSMKSPMQGKATATQKAEHHWAQPSASR